MKKTALIALVALTACTAKAPLSLRVVESEMARCPEATFLDGQEGRLKWNYTTGLELKSFLDVYEATGREEILDYVDAWYDAIIAEDGTIATYKKSNYSTDHVCPGRTLFQLYDITGKEKYRTAMDSLYVQVLEQPRTEDGGFWHKQVYPGQMWLDGLYMGGPFWAEYTARYGQPADYQPLITWFRTMDEHCYDPGTDLYRHACDVSREMPWADKQTGWSDHCWGRGMGWFFMSAVDAIEFIPEGVEGREVVLKIIGKLASMVKRTQDPESGAWYQVIDRSGDEGNYLESTCTGMFMYSLLKGIRLGVIDRSYLPVARKAYEGFIKTFVTEDENGLLNVGECCMGAGLGGTPYRSGNYEYYCYEARKGSNSPFATGSFIMAGVELEKLKK